VAVGLQVPGLASRAAARAAAGVSAEDVWRAPLLPAALAVTGGIVLDRIASVPAAYSLVGVVVCLVAWAAARGERRTGLSLVYLWLALAALGAADHHQHVSVFDADDIGDVATPEPRPAHLYGIIVEEPTVARRPRDDALQTFRRPDSTVSVLRTLFRKQDEDWLPASGRVQLIVSRNPEEEIEECHAGDRVEVVGRLQAPSGPSNPGEFDYAASLRDRRIRAVLRVQKTSRGVTRLAEGWRWSLTGRLAAARGWGKRTLQQALPEESLGVAAALLLGDEAALARDDWDKYVRTGVVHVLAVSGQHLVVLAAFLWLAFRLLGVRRRRGAAAVALLLTAYALLTGGRPPVVRAAVMVCAACGGILLRRPTVPANSFALAWLTVAALNPTDVFNTGCQLSFLSVAVLYWCAGPVFSTRPGALFGPKPDPLDELIDASRPTWERLLRRVGRTVAVSYLTALTVWLALTPLVAARYHLISPWAILLSPPLILLTSAALLCGFLTLLAAVICWPLVPVFARITDLGLAGCTFLVDGSDRLGFVRYVGDVPGWWLWGFYPALLAFLVLRPLQRRWRWGLLAGMAWLCVGLASAGIRPGSDELRCTFLAVGHGGCTVIETPEGRTLLYDAGAMAGPDVTRRQIAPFLWNRGIRRIDEIFLSHADLDHFNGVRALLERFAVGQVTYTPSFTDKAIQGVGVTLKGLRRQGVPRRVVRAGDRLTAGSVELEVLHPPAKGPDGPENARSLVLLVRHAGHSILLTGDLEKAGLERVLALSPPRIDVLMAPHHGSRTANTPGLAEWARPRLVVACQGPPRGGLRQTEPYGARGALFLGTWPHGAITVRSTRAGLVAETFRSGQRVVVR
jgi:competence protein ComEC